MIPDTRFGMSDNTKRKDVNYEREKRNTEKGQGNRRGIRSR